MTTVKPDLNPQRNGLIVMLVMRPVFRWYLNDLAKHPGELTRSQQRSVQQQAVIGWLQTLLLVIVVAQTLFAGALRALPPDLRASLSFLHRIEWGAYLGIALIVAQVISGWATRTLVTNHFYLLAWRFGVPVVRTGNTVRRVQVIYLLVAILMVAAVVWVHFHGFLVQPAR